MQMYRMNKKKEQSLCQKGDGALSITYGDFL